MQTVNPKADPKGTEEIMRCQVEGVEERLGNSGMKIFV